MLGPLQTTAADFPAWAQLLSQGINVLIGIVGIAIAYVAYRGYRRNQSRPMLFISIGFILTAGLPFAMFLPVVLLNPGETALLAFSMTRNVATLLGLLSILYALRMPIGGE